MTARSSRFRGLTRREGHGAGERPRGSARSLSMLGNSLSLIVAKAGTMALGFLFWLVSARHFDPADVGLAAGAVSAMMLCTQLAILGTGSAIISELPRHRSTPARLLDTSLTTVLATATGGAALFLLFAHTVFHELRAVVSDPLFAALFAVMCLFGTLGILFDQVSLTLRRGDHVVVRGVLFGGVTVVLVAAVPRLTGAEGAVAVFAPWVAAGGLACAVAAWQLRRSPSRYRYRPRFERGLSARLLRVGLPNYALTLAERAPGLILPIVVVELLSPAANAAWYAVWMMAWVIFVVPISVGLALFAEGARQPAALPAAVRQGTAAALAIGIVAAAALAAAAPVVLSLLGSSYSNAGATPLRILVWAVVPLVFVQTYFAACRARRRLAEAVAVGGVSGAVAVGAAAAAGVVWGLNGMAAAWVAVQALTGIFALVRVSALSGRAAEGEHAASADHRPTRSLAVGAPSAR